MNSFGSCPSIPKWLSRKLGFKRRGWSCWERVSWFLLVFLSRLVLVFLLLREVGIISSKVSFVIAGAWFSRFNRSDTTIRFPRLQTPQNARDIPLAKRPRGAAFHNQSQRRASILKRNRSSPTSRARAQS